MTAPDSGAKVGVAVVGAGYWGINHVRVFASEPQAQLRCICDLDEKLRQRALRFRPEARTTDNFDDVLRSDDVDAIVLATPGSTHAPLAKKALEAGKHVLVEKPLAHTRSDAEELRRIAKERGLVIAVGHLMVYHPIVSRVREMLRSGELGELYYLYASRVNLGRLRSDENALWSFGPHDISIIDMLLGEAPVRVLAHGQSYLQKGIEDVVFVSLEYPNGRLAHVHLSWLDPKKERRLTLVCSKKMVEFDDVSAEKLRVYDKGYTRPPEFTEFAEYLSIRQGDVHIPHVPMGEPLSLEAKAFLTAIQTGKKPLADIDSAVRVVSVLEAAQASLRQGGTPIDIAPHTHA